MQREHWGFLCGLYVAIPNYLRGLEWPKADELIAERDLAMLHRLLYNVHAPVSLSGLLSYREDVYARETRASVAGLLHVPRVRTEHARRSFCCRATAKWNESPSDVRDAGTGKVFRTQMREWLTANRQ